jgi:hypothetical protein
MTAEEIKAELTALDELISKAHDLNHALGVIEVRQAKRRREMLKAELTRMENSP